MVPIVHLFVDCYDFFLGCLAFLIDYNPFVERNFRSPRRIEGVILLRTSFRGIAFALVAFGSAVGLVAQDQSVTTSPSAIPRELPSYLRPSDFAVDRAKEMGGEVFKLLDYAGIRDPSSVDPSYHPFQAYYSFKDRSHGSDQIRLVRGELRTGGPWNYGFFADLGEIDLRKINIDSPEAAYFAGYKVPALNDEIRQEINRLSDVMVDGLRLKRSIEAKAGHTYLLRAISFDGFVRTNEPDGHDLVVALYVLEILPDESVTIVWKKLAAFVPQVRLFMTDEELQKKVDVVITESKIPGLKVKVSDNCLVNIGSSTTRDFDRFLEILGKRNIPNRGIGNCKRTPLSELFK